MNKIGVYSGTFDPVHIGHIDFALKAKELAELDKVYFLPDIMPRGKAHVTHFAHRIAMLRLAVKPHRNLATIELPDKQFSVGVTLPRLRRKFSHSRIVMLMGSDVFANLHKWAFIESLLAQTGLVVAIRSHHELPHVLASAKSLPGSPKELHIVESGHPSLASSSIRSSVEKGKQPSGLLNSVEKYIGDHWLYSSLSAS